MHTVYHVENKEYNEDNKIIPRIPLHRYKLIHTQVCVFNQKNITNIIGNVLYNLDRDLSMHLPKFNNCTLKVCIFIFHCVQIFPPMKKIINKY